MENNLKDCRVGEEVVLCINTLPQRVLQITKITLNHIEVEYDSEWDFQGRRICNPSSELTIRRKNARNIKNNTGEQNGN